MAEDKNSMVILNHDVVEQLLMFLPGIDTCNLIEVMNSSIQYQAISASLDPVFRNMLNRCYGNRKIPIPKKQYEMFLDGCEEIDGHLVPVSFTYSNASQQIQKLFVYECFSLVGFRKLCRSFQSPLFECYSRLVPFNGCIYHADFGLLNYELHSNVLCNERNLNEHEKQFFKCTRY
jgi:hypothetical protein